MFLRLTLMRVAPQKRSMLREQLGSCCICLSKCCPLLEPDQLRELDATQDTYVDMASFGPVLQAAFAATGIMPRTVNASVAGPADNVSRTK